MDVLGVKQNKKGNYLGKCIYCGEDFIGDKRDFSCDECREAHLKAKKGD